MRKNFSAWNSKDLSVKRNMAPTLEGVVGAVEEDVVAHLREGEVTFRDEEAALTLVRQMAVRRL